jgi:predicted metal-binding membrane protein
VTSDEGRLATAVVLVFALAAWDTETLAGHMGTPVRMADGQMISTVWMRAPGQSWIATGAAFEGMWGVMMLAMMLPSMWPSIRLFRRVALAHGESGVNWLSLVMVSGYFLVWLAFGILAYGAGEALYTAAMSFPAVERAIPVAAAASLVIAGLYQLTPWKTECLMHCRDPLHFVTHRPGGGWREAVRLGVAQGEYCVACCWGLMLMQLVLGMASLPLMIGIAIVIAAEKLLPQPNIVAQGIGLVAITIGVVSAVLVGIQ